MYAWRVKEVYACMAVFKPKHPHSATLAFSLPPSAFIDSVGIFHFPGGRGYSAAADPAAEDTKH
jgi:hypothetical protein